jgi:tetratricopeptide (TPR) repeat protein
LVRLHIRSFAFLALACVTAAAGAGELAGADTDRLWLHRNLGAAYLDNDSFEQASVELAAAMALAPSNASDAFNAGVAALLNGDLPGARRAFERANELNPQNAKTAYGLGVLAKREANLERAGAELARCRELGGSGPELAYNFGILAIRAKNPAGALPEFETILTAGPLHAPRHYASALYRYGRTLLQLGRREEGAKVLKEYQELVRAGAGAELSEEDLEVGGLLDLERFERPTDVRTADTLPAFSPEPLPIDGDLRWADSGDLDGDGDGDLVVGNGQRFWDLRRGADGWTDVTASRGLEGRLGVSTGRLLDLDNDDQLDLVEAGGRGLAIHFGMQGAWQPATTVLRSAVQRIVPVDFDHEGDVDLLALGSSAPVLLRNNGDRTFADVTGASGLGSLNAGLALAVDLDDDQDVDFAFVDRSGRVVIASNLRGGQFELQPPLEGTPTRVFEFVAADFDADGRVDLAVVGSAGAFVLVNRGALAFQARSEAAISGTIRPPAAGASTLWAADYDNDGRIDLMAARENGATYGLNRGSFVFSETNDPLRALTAAAVHPIASLLLDGDARVDLIASSAKHALARNVGDVGHGLLLRPRGVKNNHDGVGAIVELLAGSKYVRADGDGHPIHFGLGRDGRVDAIRIRWPNGVHQGVLDAKVDAVTSVEEKAGLVGSCPFLYAFDGERFRYLTDILTVTPLGLPIMPGAYVPPNWDEAIRVTADELRPDSEGFLTIQVTEELREVTYLDQVRLHAIDHPVGTEVQPNEKFKFPPFPEFGVHVLDNVRAPIHAWDHEGRDVADRLLSTDDVVVGDLPLTRYQGITEMHSLTLDFGDVPADAPLTLHLSGWFYWTNASINIAISQDARHDFIPPQIEVERFDGTWAALPIEVGFPGGKTKSIPIDLARAFPDGHAKLRISTTLRLYWDRALLQIGTPRSEPRVTMLLPDSADLHFRGFSEPILSVTGEEPERFDYDVPRSTDVPWDQHPGKYTKYGDVTLLLQQPEDKYAILGSGDECTIRWDPTRLPDLVEGWTRTYFLVFDGWAKDGDPNTTHSSTVEPLPFHAMRGYPYGEDEHYPADDEHTAYRTTWNTRDAKRLIRDLVAQAGAAESPSGAR